MLRTVRTSSCVPESLQTDAHHVDVFLAVITSATEVGNTRPTADSPESVGKIHEVNFYSLTSSVWDDPSGVGDNLPSPTYDDQQVDVMSLREIRDAYQQNVPPPPVFEHPCVALKKILSSGSFYYALGKHWDISSRLAERLSRDSGVADVGAFDDRFVWNEYIVRSLLDFRERLDMQEREDLDRCQFIVRNLFLYSSVFRLRERTGPCHTRLCRHVHDTASRSTDKWRPNRRNSQFDFPFGLKCCVFIMI
jgi:synaptojanin